MHSKSGDGHLPLLHIDDSANDRVLVEEAILLSKTPFVFYQADGMDSALPFFQSLGKDPAPALVLLDYNLGNHTGADFLYWMRLTKRLTSTPVIMFSGSKDQQVISECYAMGAKHFVSKPLDIDRLKTIVRALHLSLVADSSQPSPIPLLEEYQPAPAEPTRQAGR